MVQALTSLALSPRWTAPHSGSQVFEADALDVARTLPEGAATLAILDGPYGMGKAAWDRIPRGGSLADLYAPHFDALGRVCAPSASLYVWNTAAGWAELHPHILARGWTFKTMLVWDRAQTPASFNPYILWPNVSEFCGYYTRGTPAQERQKEVNTNIWRMSHAGYQSETLRTPGPSKVSGLYLSNALHPCQKPLLFAERMISASSRPSDTVWVPFGGTLRELVAAEHMARADATKARKVITCELNADGVDYIGPAIAQAGGPPLATPGNAQISLF
jgi:DNA modification methylase